MLNEDILLSILKNNFDKVITMIDEKRPCYVETVDVLTMTKDELKNSNTGRFVIDSINLKESDEYILEFGGRILKGEQDVFQIGNNTVRYIEFYDNYIGEIYLHDKVIPIEGMEDCTYNETTAVLSLADIHLHFEEFTDIKLKKLNIKPLSNDLLEKDLVIQNSISLGRAEDSEIGKYSCAIGEEVTATNHASHAEGYFTTASGEFSHAEGNSTNALGHYSHAEGNYTTASGDTSHAEGNSVTASGDTSHAEGSNTTASGYHSHAECNYTVASGGYSHAEGNFTTASGEASHAEGATTTASGNKSHAEGSYTTASSKNSHAEGYNTTTSGESSHAEGHSSNKVTNLISSFSTSTSNDTITTQWETKKFCLAKGRGSHVEGQNNLALADSSHAEGENTKSTGRFSHSEGYYSQASGQSAHAEGNSSTASGHYSHAECNTTTASGSGSHAEGHKTTASGNNSHAEGEGTQANGTDSHAEGAQTIANGNYQHVQGKYNIADTTNKYAHIVGNGNSTARSNAHTLDWNGNAWYKGKLSQDGIPTEDKDLTTKKYVDEKTEILPVANKYIIFEDAVPRFMEHPPTYGSGGSGGSGINGAYIFDNLQNTDMIVHSAKFNLIISFNDGTEDITENIIVDVSEQTSFTEYVNDYFVRLEYNADTNLIVVSVTKEIQTDNGYEEIPCTVTKATFICILYSNLLNNNVIKNIKYKQIIQVPDKLDGLANNRYEVLNNKDYYYLYDNSFVWDMNRINERLDENSGVTQNTSVTTVARRVIKVNQKDSEGIGFGQLVPINNKRNVSIFAMAGADVIVKVYNPNTKELMLTMNFDTNNSFEFTKGYIPNYQLNGINNIFIAFTTKDIPSSYEYQNKVHNLIVTDEHTFLKKEEILTKANTKEYTPTNDYNPATKKYVDERTFSREVVTVNNVNDSLTLTTDKNQYATLAVPVEIILPTVTSFTELHLFFNGSEGVTIGTTNVKWESQVTIENNKSYEIIFTYVNESIGWLAKTVVYS